MAPRWPKMDARWPKMAPRWRPKMAEDGRKMNPRWPEKVPRWPKMVYFDLLGDGTGLKKFEQPEVSFRFVHMRLFVLWSYPCLSRPHLGSSWADFGSQDGPKMASKWPQDGPTWQDGFKIVQDGPKMDPRCPRWLQVAQDGPTWCKMLPRWLQDGPRRPQDGRSWPQDAPRWLQDGPEKNSRWPRSSLGKMTR